MISVPPTDDQAADALRLAHGAMAFVRAHLPEGA